MQKAASGLDIKLGDTASRIAFEHAKNTFSTRPDRIGSIGRLPDGAFSNIIHFGDQRIGIASDGVGTKIEIAERTGIFDTIGYDLVAMVADDLVTAGFIPTNLTNVIDVNHIDTAVIDRMMAGLAGACTLAGIAITGGEIAELGSRVGGYGDGIHVNWSATAIGCLPEGRPLLTGEAIRPGDTVIALQSAGLRSNGFSLVRRIMTTQFGDDWHDQPFDDDQTWGQVLLTPSRIYTPLLNELHRAGISIRGIAHITGGGIRANFARTLRPTGLGALLDDLFEPLPVMQRLQQLGHVSDEDAYTYWNMGNGMLLVVSPDDADRCLQTAAALGYPARTAGRINDTGQLLVNTKETV